MHHQLILRLYFPYPQAAILTFLLQVVFGGYSRNAIQVSIPPFYLPPKDALYTYKHMSDFYDGQIVLPEGTSI